MMTSTPANNKRRLHNKGLADSYRILDFELSFYYNTLMFYHILYPTEPWLSFIILHSFLCFLPANL